MTMRLLTVESMPYAENTYIVWREGQTEALVIDVGMEPGLILAALKDRGLTVPMILNTHGHVDHIAGNAAMKEAFPSAPLAIGAGDANMLEDPWANLSAFSGQEVISPPADRLLAEGDVVEEAGFRFEVLEIPGHSPGHIVFILRENPVVVFGGDVLFNGSIGRTDFPGGSLDLLLRGIRTKLWPLPDSTLVYPGHGPATTIGNEKRTNPFLVER